MRPWLATLLFVLSLPLAAQDFPLPDYHTALNDVESVGRRPHLLFRILDRETVNLYESICSNRAHLWTHQLKKRNVIAGKIFVFYTDRTGMARDEDWWYHVAPVVNSRGQLYVLDAGFPGIIDSALRPERWFRKIVNHRNCRELTTADADLIPHMFTMSRMPKQSLAGVSDCYYRITPAAYWTPRTVALNMLGRDETGTPVDFERTDFVPDELMSACLESVSRGLEPGPESRRRVCQRFLGIAP
jgi:hypothetical protein